jgi:hypothetical protein
MEVMYERVAGLDVHKQTVVACVRLMVGRKAVRECRGLRHDDGQPDGLAGVAERVAMQPRGDGSDGGLLDTCVEDPE